MVSKDHRGAFRPWLSHGVVQKIKEESVSRGPWQPRRPGPFLVATCSNDVFWLFCWGWLDLSHVATPVVANVNPVNPGLMTPQVVWWGLPGLPFISASNHHEGNPNQGVIHPRLTLVDSLFLAKWNSLHVGYMPTKCYPMSYGPTSVISWCSLLYIVSPFQL